MKHFTITTKEQAEALRQYNVTPQDPFKAGHIITPSANEAYHTCWDEYPESDAITFEECMSIVRDEVTEEVLRELAGAMYFENPHPFEGEKWIGFDLFAEWDPDAIVQKGLKSGRVTFNGIEIPNPTANKLRLLVAILRGE